METAEVLVLAEGIVSFVEARLVTIAMEASLYAEMVEAGTGRSRHSGSRLETDLLLASLPLRPQPVGRWVEPLVPAHCLAYQPAIQDPLAIPKANCS